VCGHVCVCLCMYVCMYVCMHYKIKYQYRYIHCTGASSNCMYIPSRLHGGTPQITTPPPVQTLTQTLGHYHSAALYRTTLRRLLTGCKQTGGTLLIRYDNRALRAADGGRRFIRNVDRLHGVTSQQTAPLIFIAVSTGNRNRKCAPAVLKCCMQIWPTAEYADCCMWIALAADRSTLPRCADGDV
jgi:hypothetical protein